VLTQPLSVSARADGRDQLVVAQAGEGVADLKRAARAA
jgi:hypothetical protein